MRVSASPMQVRTELYQSNCFPDWFTRWRYYPGRLSFVPSGKAHFLAPYTEYRLAAPNWEREPVLLRHPLLDRFGRTFSPVNLQLRTPLTDLAVA
jgi:hypothetical protein